MQERLQKADDVKIFILFLMYNIKVPLEFELLNEVAVQDGIVSTIDFSIAFADLMEKGNIVEILKEDGQGGATYALTDHGIAIVESLQNELTSAIRTQGLKSAMRLLNFRQRGSEIKTRYNMREDGRFDLWCEIIEDKQLVFQVKVIADNATQLELMRYTFDERPEMIYKGMLTLLTGKGDYFLNS